MNLIALALLAVSVWPMYQLKPDHNAVFGGPAQAAAWEHRLGGKVNGGLALSQGVLYVESFDRRVTALDARTGRTLWSVPVPNVVMTTPIVADGLVVVGTGTNKKLVHTVSRLLWGRPQGDYIVALDRRSGRVVWRYKTVGEDMPSPALVKIRGEDALVFANGDRHVRALSMNTGRLLWTLPVKAMSTMSSAAADGGVVFIGIGNDLIAVDAADGRLLWDVPGGSSDNSPAVADGRVFVETPMLSPEAFANFISAVDERTGKLLWKWQSGDGDFSYTGSNEMAIAGTVASGLFIGSAQLTSDLVALDVRTGRVRWKIHTVAPVKMSAVEKAGRLYFGDTAGTFYVADSRTGRVLKQRHYPEIFTASSPVIWGNTLYVVGDRTVHAIPLSQL